MTDLVPHQPAPLTASAADATARYDLLERQCVTLAGAADAIPRSYRGNPAKILLAAMAGERHGWNPVESMLNIDIVEGKPRYTAEVLNALLRAAGHRVSIEQGDGACTVTITRADTGEQHAATWTDDDARRAGLAGKDVWRKYGRRMLMWRALYDAATWIAPDVTRGLAGIDPAPVDGPVSVNNPIASPNGEEPVDAEIVYEPAAAHPADNADANAWITHTRIHGVGLPHLRTAPRPDGRPVGKTRWTDYPALDAPVRRHVWDWVTTHTLTVDDPVDAAEPAQQYALGEEPF